MLSSERRIHPRFHTFIQLIEGDILETSVFITDFVADEFDYYTSVDAFDISALDIFTNVFGTNVINLANDYIAVSRSERSLSTRQLRNVLTFADDIVNTGINECTEWEFYSGLLVWAVIDGEKYWSYYVGDFFNPRHSDDDLYHFNAELLLLTYYLIDLSMIEPGYKDDRRILDWQWKE